MFILAFLFGLVSFYTVCLIEIYKSKSLIYKKWYKLKLLAIFVVFSSWHLVDETLLFIFYDRNDFDLYDVMFMLLFIWLMYACCGATIAIGANILYENKKCIYKFLFLLVISIILHQTTGGFMAIGYFNALFCAFMWLIWWEKKTF